MTLKQDFFLETKFSNEIKAILGQSFIEKDIEADLQKGQDFAIYNVKPFKVAVRLRRFTYFPSFHNQFTIRYSRPLGTPTEIDKIQQGLVRYFLYGFIDQEETKIIQYFLADLLKFGNPPPIHEYPNYPPDSTFAVFELSQFPKDFIVTHWCDRKFEKYKWWG